MAVAYRGVLGNGEMRKEQLAVGVVILTLVLYCSFVIFLVVKATEPEMASVAAAASPCEIPEKSAFYGGVTAGLLMAKYLDAETSEEKAMWLTLINEAKKRGAIPNEQYVDECLKKVRGQ